MVEPKNFDRHAELTDLMAMSMGVDLDTAVQQGEITANELRDRVYFCVVCKKVAWCRFWLDKHAVDADAVPEYCPNAKFINDLKK